MLRLLLAALQKQHAHVLHTQQQLQSPPRSPHIASGASKHHHELPSSSPTNAAATTSSSTSKSKSSSSSAAGAQAAAAAAAAPSKDAGDNSSSGGGGGVTHVAGVDVANHNGDTPLMFATSRGQLGAAALLLNVSFWYPSFLVPLKGRGGAQHDEGSGTKGGTVEGVSGLTDSSALCQAWQHQQDHTRDPPPTNMCAFSLHVSHPTTPWPSLYQYRLVHTQPCQMQPASPQC